VSAAPLGELEQLVLLAVVHCAGDAYAGGVRAEIARRTGRDVARGAVHVTLDRLEQKGLLRSTSRPAGAADDARGGRPRRVFAVTPRGAQALREALTALRSMVRGLPGDVAPIPEWGSQA
jgi:DNA-binding PadR family transcriptional regulator